MFNLEKLMGSFTAEIMKDKLTHDLSVMVQHYQTANAILSDALDFYASKESYRSPQDDSGDGPEIYEDKGSLARKALQKEKEICKNNKLIKKFYEDDSK